MNEQDQMRDLVSTLYTDETSQPIILTPGQMDIFSAVALKLNPRYCVITYTQYGKSFTIGLGVLTRVTHYPERWTIIAPRDKQAKIIMVYIIDHIFDNEAISKKFEVSDYENIERIRRERSKDQITFRLADGSISGVQVLSAQGAKRKNVVDAIMGFGSQNIILDESSLLPDEHFAGVIRMLGGKEDTFLMQIGNAVYRNHFYKASKNPRYKRIVIDYKRGIEEGRISKEFIEEVKEELRPEVFRWMYECKFPPADAIDSKGYSPLLVEDDIERAQLREVQLLGTPKLGIDVAGGGRNKTVATVRTRNAAKVVLRTGEQDEMVVAPKIALYARKYKVKPKNIFIDNVGVGHGLWNILKKEIGEEVVGVNAGEKAEPDPDYEGIEFSNLRAQMYWRCSEWVQRGGKLKKDKGWEEFQDVPYKIEQGKKIKIKSKQELAKEGIASPDTVDSLALTFARRDEPDRKPYKQKPYQPNSPYEGGDARVGRINKDSGKVDNRYGRYFKKF